MSSAPGGYESESGQPTAATEDITLDWNIPGLDEVPFYDPNAIYDTKPEEILADDPVTDVALKKQIIVDSDSATRSQSRKGGENDPLIFGKETSDYTLKVERLVWVDGWRESTGDAAHRQRRGEMTLVVLKLGFNTKTKNSKVGFARAELRFRAKDKHGKDPEVVAWGPFRRIQTWNAWKAQRDINTKNEQKLDLGYAGQKGSLGRTTEDKTSWERIDFDSGKSTDLANLKKTGSGANGVMWTVSQNQIHNQGVAPEIRIGVLFSRPNADRYLVDFRLTAITGPVRELWEKIKGGVAGVSGDSIPWTATPNPGDKTNYFHEGADIINSIDIENLGRLVSKTDCTDLNPAWLNAWERFEVPQPKAAPDNKDKEDAAAIGPEIVATAAAAAAAAAAATLVLAAKPASAAQPTAQAEAVVKEQQAARLAEFTAENLTGASVAQAGEGSPSARKHGTAANTATDKDAADALQPPRYTAGPPHPHEADNSASGAAGAQSAHPKTAGRASEQPIAPAGQLPGPWTSSQFNADYTGYDVYSRLVSLEARAARAEERIARQDERIARRDELILKLRDALAGEGTTFSTPID
ncbi:hypothetical protein GGTG_08524 [Gaeumannomyces tritici R3-111a-1]|uniref:Uncharacterized protein n=1 Tax=Gaeumannomyces tritici (strain R3-111a-1) TaxID=644352 RepID=J3P4T8_GAET3|nr:hypothetical protein GGTG_08524 [Gaeumannomyces tritici R3-111a-1]EJT74686.1 hypothetical protein GGTG_08524 [Gaeumannomyces tritici R3-111a-1]